MYKESLAKIMGLAVLGLILYPWIYAVDFIKQLRKNPTRYETMMARTLTKIK